MIKKHAASEVSETSRGFQKPCLCSCLAASVGAAGLAVLHNTLIGVGGDARNGVSQVVKGGLDSVRCRREGSLNRISHGVHCLARPAKIAQLVRSIAMDGNSA